MMKIATLEQVNKAVVELIDAKTDKQLNAQIVEAAKALIYADYGKLYLYNKDRLKRSYYSSEHIKRNTLVLNKSFTKLLTSQKIVTITYEELKQMQIKHLSREVKF